ncbi:MAG: DUF2288 domain-containing protein [Pseudomonadota bacterium]
MMDDQTTRGKLNLETAPMRWSALAPFFARGQLIAVTRPLSLLDAATAVAEDDQEQIQRWLNEQAVAPVSDALARRWQEREALLWAVVVRPFVLVQDDPERLDPQSDPQSDPQASS